MRHPPTYSARIACNAQTMTKNCAEPITHNLQPRMTRLIFDNPLTCSAGEAEVLGNFVRRALCGLELELGVDPWAKKPA